MYKYYFEYFYVRLICLSFTFRAFFNLYNKYFILKMYRS